MRHRIYGKQLNRTSAHRKSMLRNLAAGLFEHGQIETTLPKAKAVQGFAEKLITQIKGSGTDMATIAKARGYEYKETKFLLRRPDRSQGSLPPVLTGKMFEMVPGEAAFGRDGNSYIVARLKQVKPATLGADKDAHKALSNDIAEGIRQDLVRQLADGLRNTYGVTVNKQSLNYPI